MVAAAAAAAPQPVPGLMDISTDSSGRHVYAVGAPFFTGASTAPGTFTNGILLTSAFEPRHQSVAVSSYTVVSGTIIVRAPPTARTYYDYPP